MNRSCSQCLRQVQVDSTAAARAIDFSVVHFSSPSTKSQYMPLVVAKKTNKPKAVTPGVAHEILQRIRKFQASQVVDLTLFRQAKETALQQRDEAAEDLDDFHPFHTLQTYMLKTVVNAGNQLGELPELSKLMDQVEAAQDEYTPDGPPMSPISKSYYLNWSVFDIATGINRETLGTCVAVVSKALGSHPGHVEFIEQMCRTRPGFYVHEGFEGDSVVLRELMTQKRYPIIVPSGYRGQPGDLLLIRVLPSFLPEYPQALAMTTPYKIVSPNVDAWIAYFDRTLASLGGNRVRDYETLMKFGAPPHGHKYWTEYIFEAYAGYELEVVFLEGLPDVDASRPHSRVNQDR